MNKVTKPVSRDFLESELTPSTLARKWRNLEIHFVRKRQHPHVINEVNRISTIMFNLNCMDSDVFDDTYIYIVVYDRKNGEIVSFYRYILCKDAFHNIHNIRLSTATYFGFSDEFMKDILPVTIEFGRSVVNKTAQRHEDGMSAVWIGLGVLVYEYYLYPKDIKIEYFFGKFSLQWNIYSEEARNMILFIYKKHFPPLCGSDGEYIVPRFGHATSLDFTGAERTINGGDYKADRKILMMYLKNIGLPMPKLAEAYANLGGLRSFGTIFNDHLKSWETAILQKIDDIEPFYIRKFVDGYVPTNKLLFT